MSRVSAATLLEVWERGLNRSLVERGLLLLTVACPNAPIETLALFSIGQRDAHLLDLRERVFGPHLISMATCPQCGQSLELAFGVADICPEPVEMTEILSVSAGPYQARFRLPTSADLIAVAQVQEGEARRSQLLGRCVLTLDMESDEIAPASVDIWPPELVQVITQTMAQADPQADVQLNLACPACQHQWAVTFDIVSYLWRELDSWAQRLLRDIHCLASTYGWPEADILALSAQRRQFYLDMIAGS